MGNRAVITTPDKQVGVYMHWNGGRDSVEPILTYCRLHGYRCPENDDYGWARLCQVISNFIGEDGDSVGIDRYENLDRDNGDNGVYIIQDWKIVGREYFVGEEQNEYDPVRFLMGLDGSMPESHRLGSKMILDLLRTGKTISDIGYGYFFEMKQEKDRIKKGFEVGKEYKTYNNRIVVKDRPDEDNIIIECDDEIQTTDVFHWKDERESILIKNEWDDEISIKSTERCNGCDTTTEKD